MTTAAECCGLCGLASYFLVASQWGQVCRLCLRGKSRKAVLGTSVAPSRTASPPPVPTAVVSIGLPFNCSLCGEELQPAPSTSGGWRLWHADPGVRAACPAGELTDEAQRARDEALREQGRLQERAAMQKELEAVARVLSRRDEPASAIVAALIDWVQSRNEEGA